MTNQIFATLSSFALLTASAAFAQSDALKADIPFEFRVGKTIHQPGRYTVRPQFAMGVVGIHCVECNSGTVVQSIPVASRKLIEKGSLVFNRYNDTYFLSRVWIPGSQRGRELRPSSVEREMARNHSALQPAVVAVDRR